MAGVGTINDIGIATFYLDLSVPSNIFGINNRSLFNKNLKNALLLPELYKLIVSVVYI